MKPVKFVFGEVFLRDFDDVRRDEVAHLLHEPFKAHVPTPHVLKRVIRLESLEKCVRLAIGGALAVEQRKDLESLDVDCVVFSALLEALR